MGSVVSNIMPRAKAQPLGMLDTCAKVGQIAGLIPAVLECIRWMQQPSHGEDDRNSPPGTDLPVTEEELGAAKVRLQYREDHLHFAVSGMSGSGKSSLVNAFRGVKSSSPDAARVGVAETTTMIQRYPDPRQGAPYHRYVWYDVPGAGTLGIPSQHFITQGLFIFDFVILVYDVCFTEIDADILKNCRTFGIPAFIVRSKANQHINNMMDEDDSLTFSDAREKYIEDTRQNLATNLKKCGLYDASSRCYIVSNVYMYDLVKSFESSADHTAPQLQSHREYYIDEEQLLFDLLKAAVERRYQEPAQSATRSGGADNN